MRICHVIESSSGGSARVMLTLAKRMAAAGQDVHVIYSPRRADDSFFNDLNSLPVTAMTCDMPHPVGPGDVAAGLRLRQKLKQAGRFDVVHAHSSKAGLLVRLFGHGTADAIFYSPHGFYSMVPGRSRIYGVAERVLAMLESRLVAVSRFEARHALALGIAPERIVEIPNGADVTAQLTRSQARLALGVADDVRLVGFVGRFDHQKDPLLAVDVAARLRDRSIHTCMIGDGPLMPDVAASVAADGLGDRVQLCGARDAAILMAGFDCLLCTSHYEGMAVSFLEALNAGVPIVTPYVGGADELIVQGRTGLIAERTADALAEAVTTMLDIAQDPASPVAADCRALARTFSVDAMVANTMGAYEQALGMSRRARDTRRPRTPESAAPSITEGSTRRA